MAENAKWLDSIEGKTYQFTNALETMWSNMINAEVVKDFIGFGTKMIQFLDTVPGKITAIVAALAGIAKFKGFSILGLGQDAIKSFKNLGTVQSTLDALSKTTTVNVTMPTAQIQAYATAVGSLTAKQQANMLASQGLSKAQIQLAMQYNGLSDDAIREATAHVFVKQAKDQEKLSDQELLANKILLSAASLKLSADTDKLAASEYLEAHASELAAAADAQQMIMSSNLSDAAKTAALAAISQSKANMTLGASFKAMFAANPVGMILTIATTILSFVIPAVSKWHKTTEELAEAADKAINTYKETQNTLREQKQTIDELSDSYERLSKGVDLDTNENLNLTTDSYKEYLNICNDIADMYPHLVTGFDAQGNAILSLKGNVDELIQAYKDAAQAARQQMIAGGDDIWDTFKNTYSSDPIASWENTGMVQKLKLAKEMQKLINSGTQDEINQFFDDLNRGALEIDGQKYSGVERDDLFDADAAGITFSDFRNAWDGTIDVGKFKQQATKINSFIKSTTTAINTETSKVKSLMDAYLGEDLDYAGLSEKSRSYIDQVVSGFDAEFISGFDSADALYNHIKTNIIDVFKDSSVVDTISDLSNLQLEFSAGDMSYADYQTQLAEHLEKITSKFDDQTLAQVKVAIGIDEQSLQTAVNHVATILGGIGDDGKITQDIQNQINSLSVEDLQIAGQLEVPEGTILSWDELAAKIKEAKIAATQDFDITNYTDAISAHSAAISEYQEALQKLDKGSFTMDDFMELIKKYPELAKGVDISSNAFHGLSRNLKGAVRTSTKDFVKDLKELRVSLVAAGKSTDSIDQLIEAIENMPDNALDGTIKQYSTLADKIDDAKRAQDKLLASMEENPNEGYETRGEAMEYMKEAMKKGEIGSESNLWNVAEKYGFTYDSAKSINENADALAQFIAIREKWFTQDDDGDDRTDDGYSYKGTESFIKDVESALANSAELQQYLTWDYDESTGTLNFDYNNEDWDTIISILSQTKELAGLTSDEFADMMIQIGQYFGIDWGNYDDVLAHLNKIVTGTSDAKTKVEEYGQAMQEYFGENSDVDLTVRPMVKFDSTNFKDWEKRYQEIINNPDSHSEADVKNAKEQLAAIQQGDSYATVYSSTFSNEDGTKSIVVTPILPDGKVLSPEELKQYADKLLAGEEIDPDIKIKLAEFDGANSIQKANEYAEALHKAQEEYDTLRDTLQINTTIDEKGIEGLKEIKEIQKSIITKADGTVVIDEEAFTSALEGAQYTEDQIDLIIEKIKKLNSEAFNIDPLKVSDTLETKGIAGLKEINQLQGSIKEDADTGLTILDTDMFTSVLQEAGYTKEQMQLLIDKIKEYQNVVTVSGNTDPLGLNNASLSIDSLKASLSTLGVAFDTNLGKWFDGKTDLDINVQDMVSTLKAKGWTDEAIRNYINQLANTNLEGFRIDVKTDQIDAALQKANEVPEQKQTDYEVVGTGVQNLADIDTYWANITKAKTTNYTIYETTIKETKDKTKFNLFDPSTWVDGTANVQGTAYQNGSWGAPRTETALTGELGPEILVRNGRWHTIGENGAEFTQIKKGDIIFNHRQTEELLKNGHVTGRGKAYASGTAYANANSTFARYEFSDTGGYKQYDVNDKVVESWGDVSGAVSDASEAAEEFADTIDWIEVRLEEINEDLDLMNAKLENAGTATNKNNIIDQMIDVNENKMRNLAAGIKKYSDYSARLLADVPAQYREAAQDGAISITEFAGEADEKTVEAIKNYREWAQKVAELQQELEETKTTLKELALQKMDNTYDYGEAKAGMENSQTNKLQDAVDFDEERGLITDPRYYAAMMENSNYKQKKLIETRAQMQKEFDDAVQSGAIDVYDQEWYEYLDKLYEIDAEIDEANMELEEFQNAINDIYWDSFDELIDNFDQLSDETQSLIDLMDSKDMFTTPDDVEYWGADDVKWTKEGIATLGLHAQEMERAEAKAKVYAQAIDDLNAEYEAGHYSESEYKEKLSELTQGQYEAIEAAEKEKEAIVDLNKARIDAIKEGIEKEIDAYEKLIEKKKEELDAEKDLYGFQKSTREQQKNISDIERQIAALSGDNSASAIAQRKKLEAELVEAKADLEDSYYDRSISQRQEALDTELEDFQNEKDAEMEALDKYLEDVEQVVADSLDVVRANASEIGATLTDQANEYNLTVSEAVLSPWRDGSIAIDEYTQKFGDAMSSTTAQLDPYLAKWQAVREEIQLANMEADRYYQGGNDRGPTVEEINKENANYTTAVKSPATSTSSNSSSTPSKPATTTKAPPSVGGSVTVDKNATHFGSKSGNKKMASFVPGGKYTVYQTSGSGNNMQVLIGRNGSYTGWVKLTDLDGYAKGTMGIDEDQWAWIDEIGEELVLHAGNNGKLQYLTKGTAVIPHNLTEKLMDLAMNPQAMLDQNRPTTGLSKGVINNTMEISVDASVGTLLHIEHLDGNNPDEVIKIVDKAWDKKMQGLNNAMRKFTR